MHVEDAGGTGAVARHLLDKNRKGQMIEPLAAISLGDEDAKQAEPSRLGDEIAGKLIGVINRFGARLDLALGETPDQLADLLVFRAEGEVHYGSNARMALKRRSRRPPG